MLALLAVPWLAIPALAAGKVWVATDTPSLLNALSNSQNGDIVLLKAAAYAHSDDFAISGKAVSLVADSGAAVELQRELTISGAPFGASCLLQGLSLHNTISGEAALTAVGVSAALWIEDCTVRNTLQPGFGPAPAAAYLVTCTRVVVHASSFTGADGPSPSISNGSHALDLFQSNVNAFGIDVRGGNGRNATASFAAGAGSRGLTAMDGQFFAQGSVIRGGNGGAAFAGEACQPGGPGGPGANLALFQFPPPMYTLDTLVHGGAGGLGFGPCPAGSAGPAYEGATDNLQTLPGAARELSVTSPVREGQTLAWTLDGAPGDLAFVAYGLAPMNGSLVTAAGVLALQAPFNVAFAGVVPASGSQTGGVPLNELGPGVEGAILFVQSGYFDGTSVWFGAPSAAVLLDQAF
jgi:hypothetical protein